MKRFWPVVVLAAFCGPVIWVSACLNPRPEDFPSQGDGDELIEPPALPGSESGCDTNPYAHDCQQSGQGNMTPGALPDPEDPGVAAPLDAGTDAGDAQDAD